MIRNVGFCVFAVFHLCHFANFITNALNGINVKEGQYALHDAGNTLKTHTGINVGSCKFCICAVFLLFKLGKYQVPEFYITVTFAAYFAVRRAATVFRAAVKIKFRTRTARTGTDFPEVVLFSHTNDVAFVHTDVFGPDFFCFLVFFIDGNPDFVFRKF